MAPVPAAPTLDYTDVELSEGHGGRGFDYVATKRDFHLAGFD